MGNRSQRFYFIISCRVLEVASAALFAYWMVVSVQQGEAWYFTLIYLIAIITNMGSLYISLRRNVIQFVFRRVRLCPNCNSYEYFIQDTLSFRTSSRVQCALVFCAHCNLSTVFTCKCTPARCEFRVDCLTLPQVHVPFLYPRRWTFELEKE